MLVRDYKNILYPICLFVALVGLGGCTGLSQYVPVSPLQLTPAQEARVGATVEGKLIQMLGGPYHDKALADDLDRLVRRHIQSSSSFKFSVADRSAPALYPLPGGRAIVTRGLLSRVRSRAELGSLLVHAVQLSNKVYEGRATRSMTVTTDEVLSTSDSIYDPDSAGIRLARMFEQMPCEQDCLMPDHRAGVVTVKDSSTDMPDSVRRLSGLLASYELLANAQKIERADDQEQAIATYLQAVATTSDEPRILGSLGLSYLRDGQLQPARRYLEKTVKLQPNYYRTQMGLGYLYLQQGKLRQANQALAISVRLLPTTENLFLLAETREKSGDIEGAMLLYRLVAEFDHGSKLGRTSASRLAQSAGSQ